MACLRRFRLECPYSLLAFGMFFEVKAIFSLSVGLKPRKTLNWGNLFCAIPSPLFNIQEWVCLAKDVLLMSRITETLNWGSLFHVIFPFSLPLSWWSLSKSTNEPVKLWYKTSGCDISWFKTTIHKENAIAHAYISSPLKGNFLELCM